MRFIDHDDLPKRDVGLNLDCLDEFGRLRGVLYVDIGKYADI